MELPLKLLTAQSPDLVHREVCDQRSVATSRLTCQYVNTVRLVVSRTIFAYWYINHNLQWKIIFNLGHAETHIAMVGPGLHMNSNTAKQNPTGDNKPLSYHLKTR